MFSDLTLIDSLNFWDMVEKSQPKFHDNSKMKRNVVQNTAPRLHQEITTKNQQVRQLQRNRERPEMTKSTKMKKKKGKLARKLTERDAKRIGVVKSTCERKKQPETLPRISCHAVPHLDELTAVYCCPTARHIEKFSKQMLWKG